MSREEALAILQSPDVEQTRDEPPSPNLYQLCKADGTWLNYILLPLMQTRQLVQHQFGIKKLHSYLVNHTKRQYVQMRKDGELNRGIHPLPLLVSEGNGRGGGDYYGRNQELCGTWTRDIISVEENIPDNYMELVCDFKEE